MKSKILKEKFFVYLPIIILLSLVVFFSIATEYFLSVDNLFTIVVQSSIIGFLALGVTFVIITAGIDLSGGSVLALAGVVLGILSVTFGFGIFFSIFFTILVIGFFGLATGFIIAKGGIAPFVVTLGGMLIARGFAYILTDGQPIYLEDEFYIEIAGGFFLGIPLPIYYFSIAALVCWIVLSKTVFGRHIYAVGSNETAARLSGIKVDRVKMYTYMIAAILTAIGGIMLASRLNSSQPTAGLTYELDAIAAVVIGGTSLMGGIGSIRGTVIGVLLLGVLKNGLNLMDVNQFWQMVATGSIVILAVYIDTLRAKR